MKAVHMTAAGGPEVLQPLDLPEPELHSASGIKVRGRAAGINPVGTKLRGRGLFYPDALPAILGLDGAGVVEAVGAEVTRFRPGDEVWYCNGGLGGEPGNYAEYHIVDETVAQPKPRASISSRPPRPPWCCSPPTRRCSTAWGCGKVRPY